jgi:L-2,4-diaminobutyrate decarboxylase
LSGIEFADSIAWDAHKMLYVPALCTYLLYKNARYSWDAFSQDAPYLFDSKDPQGMAEYDGGLRTFECTKGAISLGLWGVWSLYGKGFFATLLDKAIENTRILYNLVCEAKDFEAAHDPQCNILCFRYVPTDGTSLTASDLSALQQSIRRQLIENGQGYITGTRIDGDYWLRVTVINPQTDHAHITSMLNDIRSAGLKMLASDPK